MAGHQVHTFTHLIHDFVWVMIGRLNVLLLCPTYCKVNPVSHIHREILATPFTGLRSVQKVAIYVLATFLEKSLKGFEKLLNIVINSLNWQQKAANMAADSSLVFSVLWSVSQILKSYYHCYNMFTILESIVWKSSTTVDVSQTP